MKNKQIFILNKNYFRNDFFMMAMILFIAAYICFIFRYISDFKVLAAPIFLVAVVLVSRYTKGYLSGMVSTILGALGVIYFNTYPNFTGGFSAYKYSFELVAFLAVSLTICDFKVRLKKQLLLKNDIEIFLKKERLKSDLLRSISHDLRTPLTGIIGSINTLLENENEIDEKQRNKLLTDTNNEAERLLRITENLLSVTKLNNESVSINKQAEAAEEVVAQSVSKIKKYYGDFNISVSVPDELLMVPMDALLIEQVIFNLVENACKHSETATEINLSVYTDDAKNAVFEIRDNGVGIDEEKINSLFNDNLLNVEFGNEENCTRFMGIGLSVCNSIVQAHDGNISAFNNKDGGATFMFTLPLKERNGNNG